ncbi:hypothetical protein FHX52_3524 [Humibacillus xanthopallidus]|uniref:Regulator of septum formation n=1 Tax=Humibacillus xanthopallidus TaxID=412689 RepID=A0A543PRW7_9MICO|nr:hypothetical protein [Humibacillus xanthopallidus]TQN46795.1 hypothetical protein FHX52_3524 [Humibacillus xanthopallidus]
MSMAHARRRAPRPTAMGGLVGVAVAAAIALAACGQPAPDGSRDGPTTLPAVSTGPLRPVTAQRLAADGALECPAALESPDGLTVPQKPQGVDGAARLLPERDPASLVVCAYPTMRLTAPTPLTAPFARSERTVLNPTQRRAVVELLTWASRWNGSERPCTAMAGDETAYLVGATYGGAIVWVAAKADANACSRGTNGDFVTGDPVGVPLKATVAGQALPAEQPCDAAGLGRLDDDRTLAPEGSPAVTVCRLDAKGTWQATALDAARSAQVLDLLRSLPTRPTDHVCEGAGGSVDARFTLLLRYAAGPALRISVDPACSPGVLGSGLESADAGPLVDLVAPWSPPIPGPDPNGSVSSP